MGFKIPESPVTAVGYTAAFSAEQVIRDLATDEYLRIEDVPSEVEVFHHSEAVYEVTVTVRKIEV